MVSEIVVTDEFIEPDELIDQFEFNEAAASIDCAYLGDSIFGYLPACTITAMYEAFLHSENLEAATKIEEEGDRYILYTDITDIDAYWDFVLTKFITITYSELLEIYPPTENYKLDELGFLEYSPKPISLYLNSNPFREMKDRQQMKGYIQNEDGSLTRVLMVSDVIKILSLYTFHLSGDEECNIMCIPR